MLSERGSMTIDERTNSLLVRELPENILVIRDIIESLDIPVKQVQIEARIVTVSEGNMDELGIRWGFSSINGNNTLGGSIENNLANEAFTCAGLKPGRISPLNVRLNLFTPRWLPLFCYGLSLPKMYGLCGRFTRTKHWDNSRDGYQVEGETGVAD